MPLDKHLSSARHRVGGDRAGRRLAHDRQTKNLLVSYAPQKLGFF